MAKMYRIKGPDGTFQGTLQEFRVQYLNPEARSTADEDVLNFCTEIGLDIQEYHTIDPVEPEQNPHNFHITGYSNVTAMHPVGSYIGWSKGPTVFATPMIYLSEANDKIDELQEQIDDLQEAARDKSADTSIYQFFKDVVAEAKRPSDQRGISVGGVLHSCSIPDGWFGKKGTKLYLTDQYINSLKVDECRVQLALFIQACYQQR